MAIIQVQLKSTPNYVEDYNVDVHTGDIILFSADGNSNYLVTIKNTKLVFGTDNFVRYIVAGGLVKTPPILATTSTKDYEVHCESADIFALDPNNNDAPPRIIRVA